VTPAVKVCPVKLSNKAAHALEDCQIFLYLGLCTRYVACQKHKWCSACLSADNELIQGPRPGQALCLAAV
jgi:hypothetical protein